MREVGVCSDAKDIVIVRPTALQELCEEGSVCVRSPKDDNVTTNGLPAAVVTTSLNDGVDIRVSGTALLAMQRDSQ